MTNAHDAKAREIYIGGMLSASDQAELREAIATALRDCEREALERAAKVGRETFENAHEDVYDLGEDIEAAIRALAQEAKTTTGGE